MKNVYHILEKENIEEMARLTGKTEDELERILDECERFGKKQIFWKEYSRWFGVQLYGELLVHCTVSEVMAVVLRREY